MLYENVVAAFIFVLNCFKQNPSRHLENGLYRGWGKALEVFTSVLSMENVGLSIAAQQWLRGDYVAREPASVADSSLFTEDNDSLRYDLRDDPEEGTRDEEDIPDDFDTSYLLTGAHISNIHCQSDHEDTSGPMPRTPITQSIFLFDPIAQSTPPANKTIQIDTVSHNRAVMKEKYKREYVIPDFLIFATIFHSGVAKADFPIITAEVKPIDGNKLDCLDSDSARNRLYAFTFQTLYFQIVLQGVSSFLQYKDPGFNGIFLLAIVGDHFQAYYMKRPKMQLQRGKAVLEKMVEEEKFDPLIEMVIGPNVSLFNDDETDFSDDWRDLWRKIHQETGLALDMARLKNKSTV